MEREALKEQLEEKEVSKKDALHVVNLAIEKENVERAFRWWRRTRRCLVRSNGRKDPGR